MKQLYFKRFSTLLIFISLSLSLSAQKYLDQTNPEVKTDYNGHAFNSKKSLAENLEGLSGFSVFTEILSSEAAQQLIAGDFMGTVFVLSDSGFNDESNPERSNHYAFPENKNKLLKFLTVPGRLDMHSMEKAVSRGRGKTAFATLDGEKLNIRMEGETLVLYDSFGNSARIIATNFYHSNGFFHLAEGLLLPMSVKANK